MLGRLDSFPIVGLQRVAPAAVLPRAGPRWTILAGERTYDEAGFPN